jgi:ribosomal protein L32
MREPFTAHLNCPAVDKIVAVAGNLGSWLSVMITTSDLTVLGGLLVSFATGLYFFARAAHQWQRMQQERDLHDLRLRKFIECPECGEFNLPGTTKCTECETGLDP